MSLVRVWTDVGAEKNVSLLARIVETRGDVFVIQYLSPTDDKTKQGYTIYRYEDDTYEVDDSSITHYLDSSNEADLGYTMLPDGSGMIKSKHIDEDKDYVPDEEEEEDEYEEEEDFEDDDGGEDEYEDED